MTKKTNARLESQKGLIEPGTKNIDQFISQQKKEVNQTQAQEIITFFRNGKPGQRISLEPKGEKK